ncbi:hypothetical protein F4703DRAFT_1890412 [Phycomyces blakesleeanus]
MNLVVRNNSRSLMAILAMTPLAVDCVVLYYYSAAFRPLQTELFLLHHQTWIVQNSKLIHDWIKTGNCTESRHIIAIFSGQKPIKSVVCCGKMVMTSITKKN